MASFVVALESCSNGEKKAEALKDQAELLSDLFSTGNLEIQNYQIDPSRDTTLRGSDGTILRIFKNTFVDENGKNILSPVEIELKEALNPVDIVSANLTTTSNGKPLQTGGMIYLNAKSGQRQIRIAGHKAVGVIVPQEQIMPGMKIYKGVDSESGVNWIDPVPTLNEEVKSIERAKVKPKQAKAKTKKEKEFNEIEAIFDFVDADTTGMHQAKAEDQKRAENANDRAGVNNFGQFANELAVKGQNFYAVDYNTSYIFELKDLGWANIDRLYSDPRTRSVELTTKISNSKDFDNVYITMVVSEMYLPG